MKTLAEVKRILGNTGFPFHVVALEEVGGSAPDKWSCGGLGENTHEAPGTVDSVSLLSLGRCSACLHQCCAVLPRSQQGQRRPTRQLWTASCSSSMC